MSWAGSAFVVGTRVRLVVQLVGLIVYVAGDLAQGLVMLARVVGTEQQLTAALELDAEVCLSAAAVTAVIRRQCGYGGYSSSHIRLISSIGVTESNVPNGEKDSLGPLCPCTHHPIMGTAGLSSDDPSWWRSEDSLTMPVFS